MASNRPTLHQLSQLIRGTVVEVDLTVDTTGHEQIKIRPAVIVSMNQITQNSQCVIVVPLSSFKGLKLKTWEVGVIPAGHGGLKADSFAQPQQVRAIDKERILDIWGILNDAWMLGISDALDLVLS